MKCEEVMKRDVISCRARDTVAEVALQMRTHNVGFVPVCDMAETVIGTVTDRDLVIRALAQGLSPESTLVAEVMSRDTVYCSAEDDLRIAEERMSQYKKSRIVVVDAQKRPIGVISLSAIARVEKPGYASAIHRSIAQREAHP